VNTVSSKVVGLRHSLAYLSVPNGSRVPYNVKIWPKLTNQINQSINLFSQLCSNIKMNINKTM